VEATVERQQLTEDLLATLQETDSPSAEQLDRIERLISTRDELEVYVASLMKKVRGKMSPDRRILDRIERLLRVLQRIDEEAA
jgi:hypothetical protein